VLEIGLHFVNTNAAGVSIYSARKVIYYAFIYKHTHVLVAMYPNVELLALYVATTSASLSSKLQPNELMQRQTVLRVSTNKRSYHSAKAGIAQSVWGLGYGLEDRGSIPGKGEDGIFVSLRHRVQTGYGDHSPPPTQWVPGALTQRIKRPGHEDASHFLK
jgi:hypothetical protein